MGYRSTGWFMLPRSATVELERRHRDQMEREHRKRIVDKEEAEEAGKHFIYAQTKPWDSLTGFNEVELFERDGREYVRYDFDGWKWYSGYPFPALVETMIYNVADPDIVVEDKEEAWLEVSPILEGVLGINQPTLMGWELEPDISAFTRTGEDWNDIEVLDDSGEIEIYTEMDGNPWFNDADCIFAVIDRTHGTAGQSPAARKASDEAEEALRALKPDKIGDLYSDSDYPAFHWNISDRELWGKIIVILEKLDEWEVNYAAIRYDEADENYDSIGEYYDYDIYLNRGWDETDFMDQFTSKGRVPIEVVHPYLKEQEEQKL